MAGGGDYYSLEAILAEETYVPVRLVHGCTGAAGRAGEGRAVLARAGVRWGLGRVP